MYAHVYLSVFYLNIGLVCRLITSVSYCGFWQKSLEAAGSCIAGEAVRERARLVDTHTQRSVDEMSVMLPSPVGPLLRGLVFTGTSPFCPPLLAPSWPVPGSQVYYEEGDLPPDCSQASASCPVTCLPASPWLWFWEVTLVCLSRRLFCPPLRVKLNLY